MTIDYVVKKKAIDLHLQGRGRNEIARILNGQKMRISEATITHLIQDWKRQHQEQEHSNSEPSSQLNKSAQTSKTVSSISQGEQQQETITISPQAQTSPQYTAINIGTLTAIYEDELIEEPQLSRDYYIKHRETEGIATR